MNIAAVKRSISTIMDIRSQTGLILQRARKAEDLFQQSLKELDTCKALLDGLVVDLAGHCTTYLFLLQKEESEKKTTETAA